MTYSKSNSPKVDLKTRLDIIQEQYESLQRKYAELFNKKHIKEAFNLFEKTNVSPVIEYNAIQEAYKEVISRDLWLEFGLIYTLTGVKPNLNDIIILSSLKYISKLLKSENSIYNERKKKQIKEVFNLVLPQGL